MTHESIAAYASCLLSIIGIIISVWAIRKAENSNTITNELQKNMFKKDKVIDLAMAWNGINAIDPENLITPDVVKAVNALELTASLWNHDVVAKEILHQSYWQSFRDLYDVLYHCNKIPPGLKKTCRDYITKEISKAYEEIKRYDLNQVAQTTM
ncbi:MAG: hypothetical protein DYG83_11670 [Candidatus Brocadia sp. AMX2]|uniref:Uncharacterized protein n=1 Tax=Candidatus Brocadia sinica JPN1 TaxID=1197129 RepID=A0ABQ0JT60_9BACT|nr:MULTISPECIES: hypothetical protein [Brocadia]KXK29083.1 MAG: hypothetical protein UZ01_02393 [Candidatus Brocadia sinica]MBC6933157.1 hypothetical protein [Candidatus Brocadia sp.]MBL1168362.1 hypothetical protein [Candidatus Brocadia sp. AMX1]NOG43228.1 hypothetical protein [Planctomycetota bacterium]KAA0242887.1 MAG: hypothetical protein EDM70_12980 [Candidatus Brocadia sp. AMX2]